MKFLSLICVIVVLVLNFVPCADAQETGRPETTLIQLHSDSSHAHPLADSCSPFCHCSCCANSSIANRLQLNSVPSTEYAKTNIPYLAGAYIDVAIPVWQPPQWM